MLVRTTTADDLPFLRQMLYEAACWRPGDYPPLEQVLERPSLSCYLAGWGRRGDEGVVAVEQGRQLGAAWYRLFTAAEPGRGFVSEDVPELTIAVAPEARGRGMGRRLLGSLIERARAAGYESLSLSVEPDNEVALHLYERAGFETVATDAGAWTMTCRVVETGR